MLWGQVLGQVRSGQCEENGISAQLKHQTQQGSAALRICATIIKMRKIAEQSANELRRNRATPSRGGGEKLARKPGEKWLTFDSCSGVKNKIRSCTAKNGE